MMILAGTIVSAFALFQVGLAGMIFARPSVAERFLRAFARSASVHYAEQLVRLAVGASLVAFSSEMEPSDPFRLSGWVVVATTIGLLCVPWRWHRAFARRVVPPVIRHLKLFGAAAALLGVALLYGVFTAWAGGAA